VYLDFETANISTKLSKAKMTLQVAKNWISATNIKKENIALFHLNEFSRMWNEINTTYLREDNNYYYYQTSVDSFSYFYIGEKTNAAGLGILGGIWGLIKSIISNPYVMWTFISIIVAILLIIVVWKLRAELKRLKIQRDYRKVAGHRVEERPIARPVERPRPVEERPVARPPVRFIENKPKESIEGGDLKRKVEEIERKQRMNVLEEMRKRVRGHK
jgi:hypothetical protein